MNRQRVRNKSLLFIVFNNKKSGGFNVINKLGLCLSKEGYIVSFLAVFGRNNLKINRFIKVYTLIQIPKLVFKRFDLIISTFWPTVYLSLILRSGKKVYFVQNWEPNFYKNIFLKKLAETSYLLQENFITISDYLEHKIRTISKKKRIVKLKLYIEKQYVNQAKKILKKEFIIRNTKTLKQIKFISNISSYSFYKGVWEFEKLCKYLKNTYPSCNISIISYEKKPLPYINNHYYNLNVKQIIYLLMQSDVFLQTSNTEGFSLTPLEAMACGLPVVMTESGGNMEYAKHYRNCLVGKDVRDIIENKLVENIINNIKFRRHIINEGLATASQLCLSKSIKSFQECVRYYL